MRIRRRTAAWLCALALLLSLAGAGALLLRPERIRQTALEGLRAILAPGYDAELDDARFDLRRGAFLATGLRIVRTAPAREVLVSVPRLEASSRLWQLLGHLRATDVKVSDPEILVERTAEGRFPLLDAFLPSGAPPGARPRIRASGGLVRIRDAEVLAPGEEARFALESLDLRESPGGKPSTLEGVLRETGSPVHGGTGALGRVVVRGAFPPGPGGIQLLVERFDWNEFLLERLSAGLREKLALFSLEGTFGEGPQAPGLEVLLARGPGGGAPEVSIRVRPRDASFLLRDLPLLFTGVSGDLAWDRGELRVEDLVLRREAAELHLDGRMARVAAGAPFEVRFWARSLYLDRGIRNAFPPAVQRVWEAYDFSGVVDLTAAPPGVSGSPDCFVRRETEGGPIQAAVVARLVDGEMSFRGYRGPGGVPRGFAYAVSGVRGRVDVRYPVEGDGVEVLLTGLEGRHGDVKVAAHGSVREFPGRGGQVAVDVKAEEIPIDEDLRAAAPVMDSIFRTWSPRGIVKSVRVAVTQVRGQDSSAHEDVTVELDGRAGLSWAGLPLALEEVGGVVQYRKDLVGGRRVPVVAVRGARGRADGAVYEAEATVEGSGEEETIRVSVRGEGVPVDGALAAAIREARMEGVAGILDRLRPGGLVDLAVDVRGPTSRPRETVGIVLRGVSVRGWGDDLRLPLADLEGRVEVSEGSEGVALRGIRGRWEGREVALEGEILDPGGAAVLDLRATVPGAPLDESVRPVLGGLAERLEGYFSAVRPAAGLRGDLSLRLQGPASSPEPTVTVEGLRGGAAPLGLRGLLVGGGRATYAGETVVLEDVAGALEDREFRVRGGRLDLRRGEGTLDLAIGRLRIPGDLVGILSEETAAAVRERLPERYVSAESLRVTLAEQWRRVTLDGPLVLAPRPEGETAGLGLEGTFRLEGVTLLRGPRPAVPPEISGTVHVSRGAIEPLLRIEDLEARIDLSGALGEGTDGVAARLSGVSARVEGRDLREAGADLVVRDGSFLLKDLRGRLANGNLGASVEVGGEKDAFYGKVTLGNAGARALLTPGDATSGIRGAVNLSVSFRKGLGAGARVGGQGEFTITGGRIMKVPVFDGLYGILGVKDPPEFTRVYLRFSIDGDRISFEEIELDSSILALHKSVGGSHAWIDGRLDINLRPEYKGLDYPLIEQLKDILSEALRPLVERIHTVHVGGTVQRPEVSNQIFSALFASGEKGGPRLQAPPPVLVIRRAPPIDF